MKYQEELNLLDMLRQKQYDVNEKLSEMVKEIMVVEKMMTENPLDGLKKLIGYRTELESYVRAFV